MYKMHFLSCVALTLAFVVDGAPTSGSSKKTQEQLGDIMEDLQKLLKGVNNYKNHELSMMLTFKFYIPRKVTGLTHLHCLSDELSPLKDVLSLSPGKYIHLSEMEELVNNINITAEALANSQTGSKCEYDEERVTAIEFLNKWITFCQSIFSRLT